jgi:hypothetical protein
MRDRETIDSELRLLVAVRQVCRELDGTVPSTYLIAVWRVHLAARQHHGNADVP